MRKIATQLRKICMMVLLLIPIVNLAQSVNSVSSAPGPHTILWKISGNGLQKTSYLLGTMHLGEMDWLMQFSEMQNVLDSTDYILTEAFSTEVAVVPEKPASALRAVSILNAAEYKTLDSFFVARVGEGISNNPDAEEMSVWEMWSAILHTLTLNQQGANGTTSFMDLDLFQHYQSRGKGGDHLDKIKNLHFDSTQIEDARKVMRNVIAKIPGSNQAGWNIYSHNVSIREFMDTYKRLEVPYHLEKADTTDVRIEKEYAYLTVAERNRNWMPKIESNIRTRACLIAVGLGHLRYNTGLIVLLRKEGFQVEPVPLRR